MFVAECDSTNTLLRQLVVQGNPPDYIYAGYQTAGRGQTGNGWESQPGKNLLCSILLPAISHWPLALSSFELNVRVSVAVHRMVSQQLTARSDLQQLTIKWPNDIYWQDKKVAGILIENAIVGGELRYSIAGIGLNVNQTEWLTDAPNPVSLKQIAGKDFDIDELMLRLMGELKQAMRLTHDELWDYYRAHLYRRKGLWPFLEREVSIAPTMNANGQQLTANSFLARICDILPTGEILLEDEQGQQRKYHFKQVRYVIEKS